MHELSLCRYIIDIINEHVSNVSCSLVKKVTLETGELAGVDQGALRFGFDVTAKGTVAEGALLEIITIPGQAICDSCQKTVPISHYYDPCQTCGQFSLTVTQGDELRVKSMEVE